VTGRLVDSTSPGQNAGAPHMTVPLREVTAGGPGDVVAADVATWGDACAAPLGRAGKVRLDKVP
jgi:hypothetical protein